MRSPRRVGILAAWLVCCTSCFAQEPSTLPALQTGAFHIAFTEPDPRSALPAQTERYSIRGDAMQRYSLADESFEAYVPHPYDPTKPYGVFVWVSASDRGSLPRGWRDSLEQLHLIAIGANNSGNERGVAVRLGLAMDAVHNLKKQYAIDDTRIYIGGNSGGGKIASMLGVLFPDVFNGSVPIVGVAYFSAIPLADDPRRGWAASYAKPSAKWLEMSKNNTRFVLITGANDMNRDSIEGTYQRGFLKDGFSFASYIEVEGMGHATPDAGYFEKAIAKLDEPLGDFSTRDFEQAQTIERARRFAEAKRLYGLALLHADETLRAKIEPKLKEMDDKLSQSEILGAPAPNTSPISATAPAATGDATPEKRALAILSLAKSYENSNLPQQAKEKLRQLLKDYPTTPAAAEAKAMLTRLGGPSGAR
jgi:predicted esterase